MIDPPDYARKAAGQCGQHAAGRSWLASRAVSAVLGSPIILYDYPEIAGESTGSLFDATEIDEILMLRVLTMTDAEKGRSAGYRSESRRDHRTLRCDVG